MLPDRSNRVALPYKIAAQELSQNREQWEAYQSSGHFVVLAGPGSGKTKVLTTKLARILHEDTMAPRGVACLTYSSECARELKRRLAKLGLEMNRRIFIGTVHSFCFQNVVVPFARLGGLDLSWPIRVATDSEKDEYFSSSLEEAIDVNAKPSNWSLRCSNYRRRYVDRTASSWLQEDGEAARVIEAYERALRKNGLIDFDDMMLLGLSLIERHRWVRQVLQSRFPAIVVDEYQDLGVPLHRLVLSLCFPTQGPSIRLFAVGDPDQSIYGFTGAEPGLLKALAQRGDVGTTTLKLNYRSRQDIIAASEAALGEARGYRSNNSDVGLIDFHHCKDGLQAQATHIVTTLVPDLLRRKAASGLGQIAVLYRTKGEGDAIAKEAAKAGLQFIRIDGNALYPKTPLTRWLEDCAAWSCGGTGKDVPSLRRIIREYLQFNQRLTTESARTAATYLLVSALCNLRVVCESLHQWITKFDAVCLRRHINADPTMAQELATLESLIAACQEGAPLHHWTVARFGGQGGALDHLNLMTLHSSKGLEFDVTVLFGMDQGIIPGYRETSVESKREPKRLFYVGITRARHEVHITFSGWRLTPFGPKHDGPSEFVLELQKKLSSK